DRRRDGQGPGRDRPRQDDPPRPDLPARRPPLGAADARADLHEDAARPRDGARHPVGGRDQGARLMDPRLLRYYERELQFVREMGAEYAAEYPKIASRLTLQGLDCADPYVERLLEGFAFLAARVQLKLDAEFPRLTQHLLESVCPNYLAPTPSMSVVQLVPDFGKGSL